MLPTLSHRLLAAVSAFFVVLLVVLFPALAAADSVGNPYSGLRRTYDGLTDLAVWLNALCGLAAVLGPLIALDGGRKAAARTAVVLTSATVVLAVAVMVFLKLAAIPDTGNCLLLVIPVTLLAMLSCLVWILVGPGAKQKKT